MANGNGEKWLASHWKLGSLIVGAAVFIWAASEAWANVQSVLTDHDRRLGQLEKQETNQTQLLLKILDRLED